MNVKNSASTNSAERRQRPISIDSSSGAHQRAIRELRELRAQYALAQEALRRSERLAVTGRLAASIAHEINNPLEAVTNLLYLIGQADTQKEARKYLATAEQELARVVEITKQTLRFGREPSKPVDTDLTAIINAILLLYRSRLISCGVTVEREFLSSATILASPGEVRQVVANLIGNAIDAMRHSGRLRIRISSEHDPVRGPRRIRLTIADTGGGIPKQLLPNIFQPFVTTKGEAGTGLGLWVTDEIMKKNGWTVRVKSSNRTQHSGTTFSILIPTREANAAIPFRKEERDEQLSNIA